MNVKEETREQMLIRHISGNFDYLLDAAKMISMGGIKEIVKKEIARYETATGATLNAEDRMTHDLNSMIEFLRAIHKEVIKG